MSLSHSPQVITDGLTFYYDMFNRQKSWRGRKNLAKTSAGVIDWSIGNLTGVVSRSEVVANEVYRITCTTSGAFRFSFNLSNLINGGIYTLSFKFRYINAAINDFVLTDWNDTSITRETISLGDGVYFQYGTGTRSTYDATYRFMDASMSSGQIVELWDFQLEQNTIPTVYVNNLLSNTEQLIDLTNQNTITANTLTYAADGTFSFNGSSNLMIFPENSIFNSQSHSVEVWVRTNATTQNGFWFEKGNVNTQYSLFQEGGVIQWRHRYTDNVLDSQSTTTATYLNTTNWAQVVGTYGGGLKRTYINGALVSSRAESRTVSTNTNGCSIGVYGGFNGSRSYWYNGDIGIVKVYNRALTALEIQQNFNALRGRYGV
jgi:hypothetical protein